VCRRSVFKLDRMVGRSAGRGEEKRRVRRVSGPAVKYYRIPIKWTGLRKYFKRRPTRGNEIVCSPVYFSQVSINLESVVFEHAGFFGGGVGAKLG
jgi:hypothetical protein